MSGIGITWENDQPDVIDAIFEAMAGWVVELNGVDYLVHGVTGDRLKVTRVHGDDGDPHGESFTIAKWAITSIKFY